jgi:XTP/dITP diphosphohydrolase
LRGINTLAKIYFATSNKHKYVEVKSIAEKYGVHIEQLSGEKLEIQSSDLLNIAKTAALYVYMRFNKPVLVEDAGLFIEALNGFPGPYSSYVYKTLGIKGVLKLLEGVENRRACFRSAAVLVYEPYIISSIGEACGTIIDKPRGSKGFGFDPIFVPEGSSRTFGEMDIDEKNKYSHRARSVDKVFKTLKEHLQRNRFVDNE